MNGEYGAQQQISIRWVLLPPRKVLKRATLNTVHLRNCPKYVNICIHVFTGGGRQARIVAQMFCDRDYIL